MVYEIWVIYDTTASGEIIGGGRTDRSWDQANSDGSTQDEYITTATGNNSDYKVLWMDDGELPDPVTQRVENEQIVDK